MKYFLIFCSFVSSLLAQEDGVPPLLKDHGVSSLDLELGVYVSELENRIWVQDF